MFLQSDNSVNWDDYNNDELWKLLQKGGRMALSELFSRFYSRLFRYGLTLGSDKETVKDGIQELFLTLWRSRRELADASSVEFYLLASFKRILLREKKTLLARQKRDLKYNESRLFFEFNIENQIIRTELKEERHNLYHKALKALTDRQREALQLRMEYGLNNGEIADVMDISEKRVRNLIYEATKRLRERIESFGHLQVNL